MPYKTDKQTLACPFLDRRTKLLPCQKEMVIYHTERGASQRQLAAMFHVSRRLITFIQKPERYAHSYKLRLDKGGSTAYYNREKHTTSIRNHRRYKHAILPND